MRLKVPYTVSSSEVRLNSNFTANSFTLASFLTLNINRVLRGMLFSCKNRLVYKKGILSLSHRPYCCTFLVVIRSEELRNKKTPIFASYFNFKE